LAQVRGENRKELVDPALFDVVDGLPVHAGCPSVRLHLQPRPTQDVLAGHLFEERMEPPRGTRLRGPIQCSLEFSRLVPGVVGPHGHSPTLTPAEHVDQVRPLPSDAVLLSASSSVLWAAPTPAPHSPISRVLR